MKFCRIFVLIALLATYQASNACVCDPRFDKSKLTEADLARYTTIAHVQILTFEHFVPPNLTEEEKEYDSFARFTVKYLDNFKGDGRTEFLLEAYGSSCDIGLREGEEWIIFASDFHGYATVFPCDRSASYRDSKGQQHWRYSPAGSLIQDLKEIYKRPVKRLNGKIETFYTNQQKEETTVYKQGKRQGERLIWWANGQLQARQYFKNGKREGKESWWYENGNRQSEAYYRDGHPVDTSRSWYEPDASNWNALFYRSEAKKYGISIDSALKIHTANGLRHYAVYDSKGNAIESKWYYRNGQLEAEEFFYPDHKMGYRIEYSSKTGQIHTLAIKTPGEGFIGNRTEIEFSEKDNSRRTFYYDKEGNRIKIVDVKDGKETIIEQNKK